MSSTTRTPLPTIRMTIIKADDPRFSREVRLAMVGQTIPVHTVGGIPVGIATTVIEPSGDIVCIVHHDKVIGRSMPIEVDQCR